MIREIAIALFDSHGGVEEGDIIVCRKPSDGIGAKEAALWLWFRADISESLSTILTSSTDIHKRRFKIPLEKIVEIDENFDIENARDLGIEYQPYLPLGEEMLFTDPDPETMALEDLAIIWDKSVEDYI